jgi:UDP-N-acetylmuramoylalanine--D-glutamate ligase
MEMFNARERFHGKKITQMGLGLLGRGIGDAKFFAEAGADLIITDLKTEAELAPSIEQLKAFPNIAFHLGEHRMEDFENRDLILRAPNAPLDSPYLARARELGIPVEMDSALFAKLCGTAIPGVTIVGITGTRGKSTTTHLIFEMAKAGFENATANRNVHLGGNERDVATLPLLNKVTAGDLVILELDSWQLQGWEEGAVSPHISIWTNFMPDHMNYYQGDMERYFRDKAAIARFQKPEDFFIAPQDIKEKIEIRFGSLAGKYQEPSALPADWEVVLPGAHNRLNAACAVEAAKLLGISEDIIKNILKTFTGLPGRIELLGTKNGIDFYNDSNSTTPEATIVALKALEAKGKPIVLIAGGSDKELEFENLAREIERCVEANIIKAVVLLDGKASNKLKAVVLKEVTAIIVPAKNMDEAFSAALERTTPGDIVLLSPGATSFGIFKNEYDRGEQFKAKFLGL